MQFLPISPKFEVVRGDVKICEYLTEHEKCDATTETSMYFVSCEVEHTCPYRIILVLCQIHVDFFPVMNPNGRI
jgi:hypothetical protein